MTCAEMRSELKKLGWKVQEGQEGQEDQEYPESTTAGAKRIANTHTEKVSYEQ